MCEFENIKANKLYLCMDKNIIGYLHELLLIMLLNLKPYQ